MAIGGGGTGGGNGQDAGFGGYPTQKELLDAVVAWLPKLTRLFMSQFQGKYQAWNTKSSLATGAPQIPSTNQSSENLILQSWADLGEKQRSSILQYVLSFRIGGSSCTRRFNRPYAECEETAEYKGKLYCVKYKAGVEGDICDQASAPSSCKRVVKSWQSVSTCESMPDEEADRFFAWLSAKFINGSGKMSTTSLPKFYFSGVPRKRKN